MFIYIRLASEPFLRSYFRNDRRPEGTDHCPAQVYGIHPPGEQCNNPFYFLAEKVLIFIFCHFLKFYFCFGSNIMGSKTSVFLCSLKHVFQKGGVDIRNLNDNSDKWHVVKACLVSTTITSHSKSAIHIFWCHYQVPANCRH